jgi:ankyrin repeat protein
MLVRAVLEGKPGLVRYLLDRGADPRVAGTLGQSPFHVAVVEGNRELVDLLIERGADVNAPFGPLVPEFEERVKSEHFVKWLKRDKGLTPLMHAASTGDFEMVAHLMAKGAKRGLTSRGWKRYPVQFACDTNNLKAAQVLLGRKPDEAEKAGVKVVISLKSQRAQLYKGGKVIRSSRVSTGRRGNATPKGEFVITDKQVHWVSTIYHVAMPYFMRLSCREIGLHAGVCPGYPASHGCIRMPHGEVRAFFGVLKIGDPVIITD